jgi:hypothetical protein
MDAREIVDELRDSGEIFEIEHFNADGECDGRGTALLIDEENQIAVMVSPCHPEMTGVDTGAFVSFSKHPEAPPRIVGSPAYSSRRAQPTPVEEWWLTRKSINR